MRSEYDKRRYEELKADPAKYAAYLERKRRERKARPGYEGKRKSRWRADNPESNAKLRKAHWAVDNAVRSGKLVRPEHCQGCGSLCKPEAHHHNGYEKEHWLDVVWLCDICHAKADRRAN